jgi:hypothetical protein
MQRSVVNKRLLSWHLLLASSYPTHHCRKICHGDARKLNLAAAMVDKTPDGKPVDLGSLEWEPHQVYPGE